MYCRYCGKEIESDSKFCQHCGKSLIEKKKLKQCAYCQNMVPKLSKIGLCSDCQTLYDTGEIVMITANGQGKRSGQTDKLKECVYCHKMVSTLDDIGLCHECQSIYNSNNENPDKTCIYCGRRVNSINEDNICIDCAVEIRNANNINLENISHKNNNNISHWKQYIIVGAIAIAFQIFAIIGNAGSQSNPWDKAEFMQNGTFFFDLVFMLSYLFFGIAGIILLIVGIVKRHRYNKQK